MGQEKFEPLYPCIKDVEPDLSKWAPWHAHFGYNQSVSAYFPYYAEEMKQFQNLSSKKRGLFKHIFNIYDDNEKMCLLFDLVFMDWPLFKMECDISYNYPQPDIILYFQDTLKEKIENENGFATMTRPFSPFERIHFTNEDEYYIINEYKGLFKQFKYSRDEYV